MAAVEEDDGCCTPDPNKTIGKKTLFLGCCFTPAFILYPPLWQDNRRGAVAVAIDFKYPNMVHSRHA